MISEKLLLKLIRYLPAFFILLLSTNLTYFLSQKHLQNLEVEKEHIKEQYIDEHKNMIQADIETLQRYINEELLNSEQALKRKIKREVDNVHKIMTSIHAHYKETKTEAEITELIKEAIRTIRFNDERGYLFIYKLNGVNVLHPTKPKREGKSFFNAQDSKGEYIVQKSINIANSPTGEGFQSWYFHKPKDTTREYKKIGFIKKFEPYNWYVGAGDYLDAYKKTVKDEILDYIALLKYKDNRSVFVIDFEGNIVVENSEKSPHPLKTQRLTIFKNFIASSKRHKFEEYKVKKENNAEKISYVMKIEALDFVIGTGFSLKKADFFIKNRINQLNEASNHILKNILVYSVWITVLVLIFTYFLAKYIANIFRRYTQDLNNKNKLLSSSQKQAKIGSWEQQNHNETLSWSDEVYRIFEVDSNDSFSFDTFISRVHPDDREILNQRFQKSVETKNKYYLEHRLLFDDGRIKYVVEHAEHFYDADNNLIRTVGTVQDITEKEKLNRQYESIFTHAREGIFLHELDGTMIDVNPYIEKLYKLPKDKIIGMNVTKFYKEEDLKELSILRRKLLTKGYIEFEIELKKIDGTPFFASIKSYMLELEGRQIVLGTLHDLTSVIRNQLLLNRSKKIFENLQEGVVITDKNGYITELNKAFKTITGYGYSDAIGHRMSLLSSGKHDNDFYKAMWHGLTRKSRWSGKVYNKKKNGEIYTSFLTISTIKDREGEVQNYIGIFTDISDVLRYEQELREKDMILIQQSKMAAMGEMIDNIAHQWKQPLNLISMSNGLIKMGQRYKTARSEKATKEAIKNIEDEVKHLTTTIDDFRNFFNPDKTKKEFLVEDCIYKIMLLLKSRFKNRNIQVIKKISTTKIYSIENELVQVLMNIINNAIDALDENQHAQRYIFIETYKEGNKLFISIKDNAGGIPNAIKEKIFDSRFTTKEEGKGTGIGLYMSTQVIHSLGGTLLFENVAYTFKEKSYKGANFIIEIPKSDAVSL